MTGNNELRLNKATMIRAVQEWIDRTFTEGNRATVADVTASGAKYDEMFTVMLTDQDRPGPAKGD